MKNDSDMANSNVNFGSPKFHQWHPNDHQSQLQLVYEKLDKFKNYV